MNFMKRIYWKEEQDYRKIIHILGLKIKLPKNYNRMIIDKIDQHNIITIEQMQYQINQSRYIATLHSANNLHQKVFPKYKNINQGKDVVLIATGPSLDNFVPIENAIYVGVNKAFKYDKVKFNYMFLQDYSGATKSYIEEFVNYEPNYTKKFLGFIPDYISTTCIIPEKYSSYKNVERYYVAHPTEKKNYTFDISSQPLGDCYSIAFPAMQFILWTNPRRIYLVGCDCNINGYFSLKDSPAQNSLAVENVLDGWKRMKEFAETYYPDTEIISINPVGLKGLFKDHFQNLD